MAKLSAIKNKLGTVAEGKYNVKVLSLEKADATLFANEPIILKVLITELSKVQTIFLNTKKEHAEDVSLYERTMYDIYEQLNTDADADVDVIEEMESLIKGETVECYAIHNISSDGQTYTNFYFNKNNNKVKAYLAMM